jgi:capping protein beta
MLTMAVNKVNVGETNISGMLTKRAESSSQVDAQKTPMSVIGRMIEDLESDIRLNLNDMYILKTKEIVDSMRIYGDRAEMPSQTHMHTLNSAILGLGLKKDGAIPGSENT